MHKSLVAAVRGQQRNPYLVGIIFAVIAGCCYLLWAPTQQTVLPSMHHLLPRRQGEGREAAAREHKPRTEYGIVAEPVEIWAAGTRQSNASTASTLWGLLTASEQEELMDLCGRCVFHTLLNSVTVRSTGHVFVATGDIPDKVPVLRSIVEGAIQQLAYYIQYDPWANAFRSDWRPMHALSKDELLLGRAGWVGTRNFEVDSGAYFFNLLWNYYHSSPTLGRALLKSNVVLAAVQAQLMAWEVEQQHGNHSRSYMYPELSKGLGEPVLYTGMIWGGFRPSDDQQQYGFNIPANMYAAVALRRLAALNDDVWQHPDIGARARDMGDAIRSGIAAHGMTTTKHGQRVYAYEVDGLGNVLTAFDDPNLPSLLSMPLLGYPYDVAAYHATRDMVLSRANTYYYSAKNVSGLGSPHTPSGHVWPLGLMTDALTTHDVQHQAHIIRVLLGMQCGIGLMHESVDVRDMTQCTRPMFEWANSMLVVLVEHLLGRDCTDKGLQHHHSTMEAQHAGRGKIRGEALRQAGVGTNEMPESARFYGELAAVINHEQYESKRHSNFESLHPHYAADDTGEQGDEYEPPSTFKFEEIRPPSKSKTKKHEPTPAAPDYSLKKEASAMTLIKRKNPALAFREWLPPADVSVQDVLLDPTLEGDATLDQRLPLDSEEFAPDETDKN